MEKKLFDKNYTINNFVFRNIPHISDPLNVFDDLSTDKFMQKQANSLVELSKHHTYMLEKNLDAYEKAINFGFTLSTWMPSRFSDGSYYVWYGATNKITTIAETCHHWKQNFLADVNFFKTKSTIIAHRSLFHVRINATLIDLRKKITLLPDLIQPDNNKYDHTQAIGKQLREEGHPGLVNRSARDKNGDVFAIFNKKVLFEPTFLNHVRYTFSCTTGITHITEENGAVIATI